MQLSKEKNDKIVDLLQSKDSSSFKELENFLSSENIKLNDIELIVDDVTYLNPTIYATHIGNLEAVEFLYQKRGFGVSPHVILFKASEQGHLNIVKFITNSLIKDKIYAKQLPYLLQESIAISAKNNQLETLEFLISKTKDEYHLYNGLINASENNHIGAMVLLIKKGAKFNQYGQYDTPLMSAAMKGSIDAIKLLIKKGADINLLNQDKKTAYDLAKKYGHDDATSLLTPLITAASLGYLETVSLHLEKENISDIESREFGLALISALYHQHDEVANCILSNQHTDIFIQNSSGWDALMSASYSGQTSIVNTLLDRYKSKKIQKISINEYGSTALILAAYAGNDDITSLLVKSELFDINQKNKFGTTPLIAAIYSGNSNIVKQFLHHKDLKISYSNIFDLILISIASLYSVMVHQNFSIPSMIFSRLNNNFILNEEFSKINEKNPNSVLDTEQENKDLRSFMLSSITSPDVGNSLFLWNTREKISDSQADIVSADICEWFESSLSDFTVDNRCFSPEAIIDLYSMIYHVSQNEKIYKELNVKYKDRFSTILSNIALISNKNSQRKNLDIIGKKLPDGVTHLCFNDAISTLNSLIIEQEKISSIIEDKKFVHLLSMIKHDTSNQVSNPTSKSITSFSSFLEKKYGSQSKQEARTAIIQLATDDPSALNEESIDLILNNYGILPKDRNRLQTKALEESFRKDLNSIKIPENIPNLPVLLKYCNEYLDAFNELQLKPVPRSEDIRSLEDKKEKLLSIIGDGAVESLMRSIEASFKKYDSLLSDESRDNILRKFYYKDSPVPSFLRPILNLFTRLYLFLSKKEPSYKECLNFNDIKKTIEESTRSLVESKYYNPQKDVTSSDLKNQMEQLLERKNALEDYLVFTPAEDSNSVKKDIGLIKRDIGLSAFNLISNTEEDIFEFFNKNEEICTAILNLLKEDGYSQSLEGKENESATDILSNFFKETAGNLIKKIINNDENDSEQIKKSLAKIHEYHINLCKKTKIPFKNPFEETIKDNSLKTLEEILAEPLEEIPEYNSKKTFKEHIYINALAEAYGSKNKMSLDDSLNKEVEDLIKYIIEHDNQMINLPFKIDFLVLKKSIKMHSNETALLNKIKDFLSERNRNPEKRYGATDYPFLNEIHGALSLSKSKEEFKKFIFDKNIMNEASVESCLDLDEKYPKDYLEGYFLISHNSLNAASVHKTVYKKLNEYLNDILKASTYEERQVFLNSLFPQENPQEASLSLLLDASEYSDKVRNDLYPHLKDLNPMAIDALAACASEEIKGQIEISKKRLKSLISFTGSLPRNIQADLKRSIVNQTSNYTLSQKLYRKYSPNLSVKSNPKLSSTEKSFFITEALKEMIFTDNDLIDISKATQNSDYWNKVASYTFEALSYSLSPNAHEHWHRLKSKIVTNISYFLYQLDEDARQQKIDLLTTYLCPSEKEGYTQEHLKSVQNEFKKSIELKISELSVKPKGFFSGLSTLLFSQPEPIVDTHPKRLRAD